MKVQAMERASVQRLEQRMETVLEKNQDWTWVGHSDWALAWNKGSEQATVQEAEHGMGSRWV